MLIEHYKRTPIALAPDEIVNATNDLTEHSATLNIIVGSPDLYHFHNKPKPNLPYAPNQIIHYHSEPARCDLRFPGRKITLAQYHCLLDEYYGFDVVRNVIPINKEDHKPDPKITLEKIRVGYSPSHTNTSIRGPFDKGFSQTISILDKVHHAFPAKFDFDVITGVSHAVCMQRKQHCNVIIDEVVTQSYHKCTLEGLSLGKLTICSLSPEMESVIRRYASWHPIENVWAGQLEEYLLFLIEKGSEYCEKIGSLSRQWMEQCWQPSDVIAEYIAIYEEVLYGNSTKRL